MDTRDKPRGNVRLACAFARFSTLSRTRERQRERERESTLGVARRSFGYTYARDLRASAVCHTQVVTPSPTHFSPSPAADTLSPVTGGCSRPPCISAPRSWENYSQTATSTFFFDFLNVRASNRDLSSSRKIFLLFQCTMRASRDFRATRRRLVEGTRDR